MGMVSSDAWWNNSGAPTPEEWTALFAGGTLVVASIAAIFALVQLQAFFNAQWDQARPYLVVDFVFRSSLMQVEIRNISRTAAAEVNLRVAPNFMSTNAEDAATLNFIFSPSWQLELLAPGRRILHTLDTAFLYVDHPEFPQEYVVHATYRDANARYRWRWRRGRPRRTTVKYDETFRLSFTQWSRSSLELDHDGKNSASLSRIDKSLDRIGGAAMFKNTIRPPSTPAPTNESVQDWLGRQ